MSNKVSASFPGWKGIEWGVNETGRESSVGGEFI